MPNITAEFVTKTNEPGLYKDDKLTGFYLRVTSAGMKSYVVKYRVGKGRGAKCNTYTIGRHGKQWSAPAARSRADEIIQDGKRGIDQYEKEREKQKLDQVK